MSIKIHHGPNGSYKTSGAIQDDAVPALLAGRLIITNVRGFTLEKCYQVFPNLPDTTQVMNLSLESDEDIEKMRTWFMWAPRGAFIIFDETQLVFLKSWREKDLARFDFPGGREAAKLADRPINWLDGWTRHRHWNWDIVLTTPNIEYIRDDIRLTSEMAYRHSNLAVIGIAGRYKEAQHDAQTNRPPLEGTIIEYKKIKPRTFKLYMSTATGVAQDTKAGKSLLRSPKLLFLLVFIAACLAFAFSMGPLKTIGSQSQPIAPKSHPDAVTPPGTPAPANLGQGSAVASTAHPASSGSILPGSLVGGAAVQSDAQPGLAPHPFSDFRFVLTGHMYNPKKGDIYSFDLYDSQGNILPQSSWQLSVAGYTFKFRGDCLVDVMYEGYKFSATCKAKALPQATQSVAAERREAERQGAQRSEAQRDPFEPVIVADNSRKPK